MPTLISPKVSVWSPESSYKIVSNLDSNSQRYANLLKVLPRLWAATANLVLHQGATTSNLPAMGHCAKGYKENLRKIERYGPYLCTVDNCVRFATCLVPYLPSFFHLPSSFIHSPLSPPSHFLFSPPSLSIHLLFTHPLSPPCLNYPPSAQQGVVRMERKSALKQGESVARVPL